MKRFTEKIFALVKRIKAAGMDLQDGEIAGVFFCGIDQDLYAIQLDKWTSDLTGKYSPTDIATELILLEKEFNARATQQTAQFNQATALVAHYGYTVNPRAGADNATQNQRAPAAAPAPAPAPAPNPPPPPRSNAGNKCDYCNKKGHTLKQCLNRRRDLQAQVDEIDAALPASIKNKQRPSRSQNESDYVPSSAPRPTALLAAGAPQSAARPPTPGPTRPSALPAPASIEATNFFEQHQVPRNKFFEFPYSSEDSA